jgi:glutamine synthetase
VVEGLIHGSAPKARERGKLQLGVTTLPPLPRDTSDRNRTSPIAFTGNKFELRAVGSSMSIAYPNIVLNTIVAESLAFLADEIESRSKGRGDRTSAIQELVRETLAQHQRILFSGDNYSREWEQEAARRGLLNQKDSPSALAHFAADKNVQLFERFGVLTRRETLSRSHVMHAGYAHRVAVEAMSMLNIASASILPAAIAYQKHVADSINATRQATASIDLTDQEALLADVAATVNRLKVAIDQLARCHKKAEELGDDPVVMAGFCRNNFLPAMAEVRSRADQLEGLVDDELWPLPKYRELLFVH